MFSGYFYVIFFFLHIRKKAECIMTKTDLELCIKAPTAGLRISKIERIFIMQSEIFAVNRKDPRYVFDVSGIFFYLGIRK